MRSKVFPKKKNSARKRKNLEEKRNIYKMRNKKNEKIKKCLLEFYEEKIFFSYHYQLGGFCNQ